MATHRVFPINDWAPAQEAMYDGSSTVTHETSAPGPSSTTVPFPNEMRMRSFSLAAAFHPRPKSSLLSPDDLVHDFHQLSIVDSNDSITATKLPYPDPPTQHHAERRPSASQKGKNAISGMFRRASISLRGIMPRRVSLGSEAASSHPRRVLRTSHGYSQSQAVASPSDNGRPTTAWRRLRQAASFRHSRALLDADLDTVTSIRDDDSKIAMPIPGNTHAPPVIPAHTGGAARAAAAALSTSQWLYTDDWQADRESGIGIAVTATSTEEVDASDCAIDDDYLVDDISKVDFVAELPMELASCILAHLGAADLAAAARTSKSWHEVVRDQYVWRESFLREKTGTYARSSPVRPGTGLGIPAIRPGIDWKEAYRVKNELDARWTGGHATPVYLNGHSDSIYCLQFDESKIITGSRDKTIRIWDTRTLACRLVIGPPEVIQDSSLLVDADGQPTHFATTDSASRTKSSRPAAVTFPTHHKASILCLQYDDNILVTGSSDATCIVYNLRSGYRPIRRLAHHSAAVLDLCFDERYIVTCSKDISICVWDRATGNLIKQLRGHTGPVNAVQMRGNTIVSCSGDFKVKLWNIETGRAIREFTGHTKGLACSQFSEDGRYVASAGNDRVIRIWDANTGDCVREIQAHENLVRSLHIDSVSGRLISGSYDTDIKVFDMETGRQMLDFPRWHASWVLSAKSDYRRIISTGQDPKILVMDFGAGVKGIEVLESRSEAEMLHDADGDDPCWAGRVFAPRPGGHSEGRADGPVVPSGQRSRP